MRHAGFRFRPAFELRHPAVAPAASRCRAGRSATWRANQIVVDRDPQPRRPGLRRRGRVHQGVHLLRAPPRPAGGVDRHDVRAGDGARRRAASDKAGVHRPVVARHPADRAAHAPRRRAACSCCAGRSSALLLEHGEFTAADAADTSRALGGFALGLVGFSVYLFALRGFYAHQDTRTPFIINVVREPDQHRAWPSRFVGRWGVLGPRRWRSPSPTCCRRCGRCRCCATRCPGSRCAVVAGQPGADGARRGARRPRSRGGWSPARRRQRRLRRAGAPVVVRHASSASPSTSGCSCVLQGARARRRARHRRSAGVGADHRRRSIGRMFKLVKKWWKYLDGQAHRHLRGARRPEGAARAGDRRGAGRSTARLKEQAANVIANQKQSEMRLNSKMTELEKLNANARQALMMASDAQKAGDATKATQYNARRRDDRQPADPGREGRREPEDDGPRVDAGLRPGQGRGRSRTAGCCSRSSPRSRSCCRSSTRRRCRKR